MVWKSKLFHTQVAFTILFPRFDLGIDNARAEIFLATLFLINGHMKKNFTMSVKHFYKPTAFES